MSHTYIQSRSSSSRTVLLLSNIGCMYDQRWPHGPEDDRSSSIQAIDGLIGSMLKKYNWRPDSEIGMLKIANRNNDEGHDDLEIVDHVLLPDVHHQGLVLVVSLFAEEIQLAVRLRNQYAEDR